MSFGQWYVSRGRITRRTFWLYYVLPLFVFSLVASVIDVALGFSAVETTTTSTSASAFYGIGPVAGVVGLLTLVPSISSTVTRLHDRGHSAWWLLLGLVPFFGVIALLVITGFLRGDGGPNRYGPPTRPPQELAGDPLYPPPHWS